MDFASLLAAGVSVPSDTGFFTSAGIVALLTLTLMEVVLGIDNVVFIAILVAKLPKEHQEKARFIGMALALVMRLGLLFSVTWIMKLKDPLVAMPQIGPFAGHPGLSGRDMILLAGGLFLIYKATKEIFEKLEGAAHHAAGGGGTASFGSIIFQIIILDLVFSLDSVITAVGMVQNIYIMIVAMLIAVTVMIACSGFIAGFVDRHPSVKILALSFLNMIGVMLLAEGLGSHINKGYIYSAMAFSLLVELINMRYRLKTQKPQEHAVELRGPTAKDAGLENGGA